MTTHTATAAPAYRLGQAVAFDGRAGTITAVSGKPDAQILTVKTYAGSFMIGGRHSKLKAMPALGDRVEIDAEFMGETIPLEVIVVQIDDARIIGRPEGAASAAFARTEWPRTVTVEHTGQHLQGCVSCYAVNDGDAEATRFADSAESIIWAWLNRHDASWSPSDMKVRELAYDLGTLAQASLTIPTTRLSAAASAPPNNLHDAVAIVDRIDRVRAVQRELRAAFARSELDGGAQAAVSHPLYAQAQGELAELHDALMILI